MQTNILNQSSEFLPEGREQRWMKNFFSAPGVTDAQKGAFLTLLHPSRTETVS